MSILTQSTIANKVSLSGIGVHTGEFVNLNILPSSPNSGIIFKRIDLHKNNIITTLEKILTSVIISIFKSKIPHKRNMSLWNVFCCNNF